MKPLSPRSLAPKAFSVAKSSRFPRVGKVERLGPVEIGHFFRHFFHAGKIHRLKNGVHFFAMERHPEIQLTQVHLKSTKKLKGKLI